MAQNAPASPSSEPAAAAAAVAAGRGGAAMLFVRGPSQPSAWQMLLCQHDNVAWQSTAHLRSLLRAVLPICPPSTCLCGKEGWLSHLAVAHASSLLAQKGASPVLQQGADLQYCKAPLQQQQSMVGRSLSITWCCLGPAPMGVYQILQLCNSCTIALPGTHMT